MSRRGQVTIYVSYFIAAIMIVLLAAFIAPMGVRFNVEMWAAGEDILNQANESIQQIEDDAIRGEYEAMVAEAKAASSSNVEILTDVYQYGWIIVIILTGLVVFLYTRTLIEFGQGGGGGFV